MATVRLTAWRRGLLKISLTRLIQRETGLTLKPAKECTDRLLGGEVISIVVPDAEAARRFVREADAIGANAEIVSEETVATAGG
ncbi:MAG TPA: hypothetical protein VG370_32705 [Chloroflexota bacterium]|nr:hypothetical protein [Chloroflexota bacterium]